MVPFGDLRLAAVANGKKYLVGSAPVSQAGGMGCGLYLGQGHDVGSAKQNGAPGSRGGLMRFEGQSSGVVPSG